MLIGLARIINIKSGGAVISPWEVDQLDSDWINAFLSEIPETAAAHDRKIKNVKARFYAKYRIVN